jgi:carboxypeptidase family protein
MKARSFTLLVGLTACLAALFVALQTIERSGPDSPTRTPEPREAIPPAETRADSERHRPETQSPPLPSEREVAGGASPAISGRLVVRGGRSPPPDALVTVRTDREEIDYPETVAALGGREALERLRYTRAFPDRLRGVGGWRAANQGRSDGEGSLSIPLRTDVKRCRFEVEAEYAAYVEKRWFEPSEHASGVVLQLEPAGKIEGTLRDERSRPVGGGRVVAVRRTTSLLGGSEKETAVEADGEGRFSIGGALPGTYSLLAKGPGRGTAARNDVEVVAGKSTLLDLVLPGESFVSGRAVDSGGKGVADVWVVAVWNGNREADPASALSTESAFTDDRGSFRIGSLRPGPHRVWGRAQGSLGGGELRVEVPTEGGVEDLEIRIDESGFVAGRVLRADGSPAVGAKVHALTDFEAERARGREPGSIGSIRREGEAGEDGAFRLTGVGDCLVVVTATLKGGGAVERRGIRANTGDLTIALPGPTGMSGRVLDASSGEPVRAFTIGSQRVVRTATAESWLSGPYGTFEDEAGAFELLDLLPGNHQLQVSAGGRPTVRIEDVEVKAGVVRRDLEIRIARGARVRGRVVEVGTGTPVAEALLRVNVGTSTVDPRSRADGTFDIEGLEAGSLEIEASHDSFVTGRSARIDLREGETVEGVEIALARGAGLDGFALAEDGSPIPGAQVWEMKERASGRPRGARTDERGYFRILGLLPGGYLVTVQPAARGGEDFHERVARELRGRAMVEEGKVARVEFYRPPEGGCRVRGTVFRGRDPVAGAVVSLAPRALFVNAEDSERSQFLANRLRAKTSADGSFEILHAPAGRATLSVIAGSGAFGPSSAASAPISPEIDVPEASEFVRDVVLPSGEIAVRVTRRSDGLPVVGAHVQLRDRESVSLDRPWGRLGGALLAQTDGQGRCRFLDLPAGTFDVEASGRVGPEEFRAGVQPGRVSERVVVPADRQAAVDLSLP